MMFSQNTKTMSRSTDSDNDFFDIVAWNFPR